MKSRRVNFYPGELFLKLLARIGEWHQNHSEKTDVHPIQAQFKQAKELGIIVPQNPTVDDMLHQIEIAESYL